MALYDISVPIREGMPVWPGDPEVRIRKALALARGDPANVSALNLGAHTGTHLDAPYHFLEEGVPIDQIPLGLCVGEARVVEVPAPVAIGPAELEGLPIRGCIRLLLKTRNSGLWRREGFQEDFVYLTAEGAACLPLKVAGAEGAPARALLRTLR